jgi:hypothetical protein
LWDDYLRERGLGTSPPFRYGTPMGSYAIRSGFTACRWQIFWWELQELENNADELAFFYDEE